MPLIELQGYFINPEHIDFIEPIMTVNGSRVHFQGGGIIEFKLPPAEVQVQLLNAVGTRK